MSDIYHITRERVVDVYDTRSIKNIEKFKRISFFV